MEKVLGVRTVSVEEENSGTEIQERIEKEKKVRKKKRRKKRLGREEMTSCQPES